MQVFDVSYHRERGWWVIEIPKVDTATQARARADIRETACECIALYLDVQVNAIRVRIRQHGSATN